MDLDPVGFVLDDLAARGALVERSDVGATVCVPASVAAALAIPEVAELVPTPQARAVFAGLGSPLVDRLLREARAEVPVARVRWDAEPSRPAQAEALARHIVFRNGVADVIGAGTAAATYVTGAMSWTAEADDRYQGITTLVLETTTGGEPDASAADALQRALVIGDDAIVGEAITALEAAAAVAYLLARRARSRVQGELDAIRAGVGRRAERERERVGAYFEAMIAEARRPRRQVARGAIEARVTALAGERDAKLRDLAHRYALRICIEPAALAIVAVRVAAVRVRARRRKGERELVLRIPPGARQPDALACGACAATTRAPLLCDDALHVLCESCAPEATGRPRCAACRSSD